uniref:Uncharacterized protein n=1 Tax=Anopheles funestus TaxID=62324 RepID=A0A182RZ50_ANOFN
MSNVLVGHETKLFHSCSNRYTLANHIYIERFKKKERYTTGGGPVVHVINGAGPHGRTGFKSHPDRPPVARTSLKAMRN